MKATTPRKPRAPRKALQLNIRVSQSERELLAQAARVRNVTVSEFVLRACQDAMKAAAATRDTQVPVFPGANR